MTSIPRRSLWLIWPLTSLVFAGRAWAEWVLPTNWPVARLVENLGSYLKQHPEDADALYALGRVHAWAFTFQTDEVALFRPIESVPDEPTEEEIQQLANTLPHDAVQRGRFAPFGNTPPEPSKPDGARIAHLEQAVQNLMKARGLAPQRAQVYLSLACVLEGGAGFATELDDPAFLSRESELSTEERRIIEGWLTELTSQDPVRASKAQERLLDPGWFARALPLLCKERARWNEETREHVVAYLRRDWLDRAAESYRRAFELARERDVELDSQPMKGPWHANPLDALVSYEAGQACLRLAREREFPAFDQNFRVGVENHLRKLEHLPRNLAITPIVLSLDGCRALDDLLVRDRVVPFDLDGDGVDELWPWIAPDACWLVWDPEHSGKITSGRQFFGSASGWFFFADGYRVLDALDDDRSGELRGAELMGIAAWFDRDSDGVSDCGEVVPVEALGIVALATEATERIGLSLGNSCGLELADGRILPTYDWVLSPVERPSGSLTP